MGSPAGNAFGRIIKVTERSFSHLSSYMLKYLYWGAARPKFGEGAIAPCFDVEQRLHNVRCSVMEVVCSVLSACVARIRPDQKVSLGATICKTVRPMLLDRCLSVCNVGVLLPNGWMDQDETSSAGRPRPWTQCVRLQMGS